MANYDYNPFQQQDVGQGQTDTNIASILGNLVGFFTSPMMQAMGHGMTAGMQGETSAPQATSGPSLGHGTPSSGQKPQGIGPTSPIGMSSGEAGWGGSDQTGFQEYRSGERKSYEPDSTTWGYM